ncbi:MAG: DUF1385 domain-containing protein [Dehalococcoidia bacterium]|nr:DUF1385 domain-containing protein [Dehalococcoidia bacterium]
MAEKRTLRRNPGRVYYGGQAVMEGVMIRGPRSMAVACRRPDGEIVVRTEPLGGVYAGPVRRIPLLRGVIVMWETLALGLRALVFSSNVQLGQEEKDVQSGPIWSTAIVSLVVVAAVFFAGPLLLANVLEDLLDSHLLVIIIEGLIRLGVVVGYVGIIGLLPDIRRVYAYHGAEHKSIHALENGDPLEAAYVQRYPTAHVRCGTSFLLTVVVVSIIVFAAVGTPELWLRILSRIVLIPVIAGISYEVIRLGGAFESSPITKVLMWPNLALQTLTTRQPDDAQVEVAIRALTEVLAAEGALEAPAAAPAPEAAPLD